MLKRTLLFANKAILKTENNQLKIATENREASVPIEDIGHVVIEHPQTFISIPCLNKLVNHNVAVVFCDEKHMPSSMLLNLDSHYIQHTHFQNQIKASIPLKKQLWQQIIKEKIINQKTLLEKTRREFSPMDYYARTVLSGDTDNREGAAARYYW